MKTVTARIRIFSNHGAPTLAMSATVTDKEVQSIVKNLGLRENPVILRASPVQDHMKFHVVRRPSNLCGIEGRLDKYGKLQPGLISLLKRIYLDNFIKNIRRGSSVKKCIIFFRNSQQMMDIRDYVREELPSFSDPSKAPYVMNHGGLGPITSKSIVDRKNEISLFLTTRYKVHKFGHIFLTVIIVQLHGVIISLCFY